MAATQTMYAEKFQSKGTGLVEVSDNQMIPVVAHVITDEDIGALQVYII